MSAATSGIAGLERMSYQIGADGERLFGYGLLGLPMLALLHRWMASPAPAADDNDESDDSSDEKVTPVQRKDAKKPAKVALETSRKTKRS